MVEPADARLTGVSRLSIPAALVKEMGQKIFAACGCGYNEAFEVLDHLIDAERSGVASHGVVRIIQYAREYRDGQLIAGASVEIQEDAPNRLRLEANGGIGIRAIRTAVDVAAERCIDHGLAMATLRGAGHTGRLGAFAERAARRGCMTITLGGGDRTRWRMVAPYGGRKALLPTNPYCIGIPGGARGPVVLDFATSMIAGGWIYAARAAGTELPPGMIIDKDGKPTIDPAAYFDGGAILPKGGHIGSGLALVAELIGEAMLGPVTKGEINWMVLAVNCASLAAPEQMRAAAEEILAEIRECPPLQAAQPVSVPGERERDRAAATGDLLQIPAPIWEAICALECQGTA